MMKNLLSILFLVITASAFAQVPSYVPTEGLIGYWPFNGNANDESGNGNDGTVNGAWIQYTPESETVIMLKSGKRRINQPVKEKTKQKSSIIPGDLSRRLKSQFNSRMKARKNTLKTFEEYVSGAWLNLKYATIVVLVKKLFGKL